MRLDTTTPLTRRSGTCLRGRYWTCRCARTGSRRGRPTRSGSRAPGCHEDSVMFAGFPVSRSANSATIHGARSTRATAANGNAEPRTSWSTPTSRRPIAATIQRARCRLRRCAVSRPAHGSRRRIRQGVEAVVPTLRRRPGGTRSEPRIRAAGARCVTRGSPEPSMVAVGAVTTASPAGVTARLLGGAPTWILQITQPVGAPPRT